MARVKRPNRTSASEVPEGFLRAGSAPVLDQVRSQTGSNFRRGPERLRVGQNHRRLEREHHRRIVVGERVGENEYRFSAPSAFAPTTSGNDNVLKTPAAGQRERSTACQTFGGRTTAV